MKNLFLSTAIVAIFIISACTKEGPQGPQGIAGTNGLNGTNGTNGNANVYYSSWTTLVPDWRDTTIDGSLMKYNYQDAPVLTQHVLDSSAVLCYMGIASYNFGPFPLPYTSYSGGAASVIDYFLNPGRIYYTRFTFDNSASVGMSSLLEYRYIVIPGGVHVSKSLKALDYNSVCEKYNIPK